MSSKLLPQICMWSRLLALSAAWAVMAMVMPMAYILYQLIDWLLTPPARRVHRPGDIVVITGASSGIGQSAALYLQRKGFQVFAGCRKQQDFIQLKNLGLHPITIDVADADQIQRAVNEVRAYTCSQGGEAAFAGLINNAGVCLPGPLEDQSDEVVQEMINANLLGAILVTKAFLPLMRQHSSRLIFTGSVSGYLPHAAVAVYTATKFAVRGLGLSLAQELRPFGIAVSVIEPAQTATPIFDKARTALDRMPYSPPYDGLVRLVDAYSKSAVRAVAVAPQQSTDYALYAALTAKYPALQYRTSWTATLHHFVSVFPSELAIGTLATTAYRALNGMSQGWTC